MLSYQFSAVLSFQCCLIISVLSYHFNAVLSFQCCLIISVLSYNFSAVSSFPCYLHILRCVAFIYTSFVFALFDVWPLCRFVCLCVMVYPWHYVLLYISRVSKSNITSTKRELYPIFGTLRSSLTHTPTANRWMFGLTV